MTATARAGAVLIADRGGLCLDATVITMCGGTRPKLYCWVQKTRGPHCVHVHQYGKNAFVM